MKDRVAFISLLLLFCFQNQALSLPNNTKKLTKLKQILLTTQAKLVAESSPISSALTTPHGVTPSDQPRILEPFQIAQVGNNVLKGTVTNVQGTSERMISYRHQQHMWLTDDGVMHIVLNQGNNSQNTSLILYSSFDNGATWQAMFPINSTNEQSTSDGFLYQGVLFIVYSSSDGKIILTKFQYNKNNKTWQNVDTKMIYDDNNFAANNPTFVVDNQGRFWSTFIRQNQSTNQYSITLIYSTDNGATWQDTGLTFGSIDLSTAKSARLLRLSDRVDLVYTDKNKVNWAYRMNNWPLNQEWPTQLIFEHEQASDKDPYASHFSVVVDQLQNIHIATRDQQRLLYLRFDSQNQAWDTPKFLTDDSSVAYMQASISTDNKLFLAYNQKSYVGILQSSDYGKTFFYIKLLVHPTANQFNVPVDFTRPRIETPSLVGSWLPVLQQFVMNNSQSLMYFNVPLGSSSSVLNNQTLAPSPEVGATYPVLPSSNLNEPLCYMETPNDRTLDLSRLCR